MREQAIVQDVIDIIDDQQHINKAYQQFKDAMRELMLVREMDGELHRVMRDVYKIEDVLWQYTTMEG